MKNDSDKLQKTKKIQFGDNSVVSSFKTVITKIEKKKINSSNFEDDFSNMSSSFESFNSKLSKTPLNSIYSKIISEKLYNDNLSFSEYKSINNSYITDKMITEFSAKKSIRNKKENPLLLNKENLNKKQIQLERIKNLKFKAKTNNRTSKELNTEKIVFNFQKKTQENNIYKIFENTNFNKDLIAIIEEEKQNLKKIQIIKKKTKNSINPKPRKTSFDSIQSFNSEIKTESDIKSDNVHLFEYNSNKNKKKNKTKSNMSDIQEDLFPVSKSENYGSLIMTENSLKEKQEKKMKNDIDSMISNFSINKKNEILSSKKMRDSLNIILNSQKSKSKHFRNSSRINIKPFDINQDIFTDGYEYQQPTNFAPGKFNDSNKYQILELKNLLQEKLDLINKKIEDGFLGLETQLQDNLIELKNNIESKEIKKTFQQFKLQENNFLLRNNGDQKSNVFKKNFINYKDLKERIDDFVINKEILKNLDIEKPVFQNEMFTNEKLIKSKQPIKIVQKEYKMIQVEEASLDLQISLIENAIFDHLVENTAKFVFLKKLS